MPDRPLERSRFLSIPPRTRLMFDCLRGRAMGVITRLTLVRTAPAERLAVHASGPSIYVVRSIRRSATLGGCGHLADGYHFMRVDQRNRLASRPSSGVACGARPLPWSHDRQLGLHPCLPRLLTCGFQRGKIDGVRRPPAHLLRQGGLDRAASERAAKLVSKSNAN